MDKKMHYCRKESIEAVLDGRVRALRRRDWMISLTLKLAATATCVILTFGLLFGISVVHGDSMFPNYRDGDVVLLLRCSRQYHRGEVVVFEQNETEYIKRMVAAGGDEVDIDEDSGTLLVNGSPDRTEGHFFPTTLRSGDIQFPVSVPKDSLYVLGDYRTVSEDSRVFGPIPQEQVIGKVIAVLRIAK